MAKSDKAVAAVREVLRSFNEGYAKRDQAALDGFMKLFVDEDKLEVVGISGISPGRDAWRLGREAVRKLVKADWDYWGQITVDVDNARVDVLGNVAWLSAMAGVTTFEHTEESLQDIEEATDRLLKVSTVEQRSKPLRMTAVLVKQKGRWRFQQLHYSFPIRSLPKAFTENV